MFNQAWTNSLETVMPARQPQPRPERVCETLGQPDACPVDVIARVIMIK